VFLAFFNKRKNVFKYALIKYAHDEGVSCFVVIIQVKIIAQFLEWQNISG